MGLYASSKMTRNLDKIPVICYPLIIVMPILPGQKKSNIPEDMSIQQHRFEKVNPTK
jgi:hypothetical protein